MTSKPDLWEVRRLSDGLVLELLREGNPGQVLIQGERRARVDLVWGKDLIPGLAEAAGLLSCSLCREGPSYQRQKAMATYGLPWNSSRRSGTLWRQITGARRL